MTQNPLLQVHGLGKSYSMRRRGRRADIRAVQDFTITVHQGESVGIAGESGSGKSTLTRMILLLEKPDTGVIRFAGREINDLKGRELLAYRREVQAVFQDSASALSPRMRVRELVAEPLLVQQPRVSRSEVDNRVASLLRRVGLSAKLCSHYPHELSGGQKQRVAVARSLIVNPKMLVLDEPVSALDVSVRSQVLNLLLDLKEERGLAYLMIAHDLAILRHVTSYLVVMRKGRIVEQGHTDKVLLHAQHPYTQSLVTALPSLWT